MAERRINVGDQVFVERRRVERRRRSGKVIEVVGEPARARCRVLWEDGHESLLYPGTDTTVRPPEPESQEEVR